MTPGVVCPGAEEGPRRGFITKMKGDEEKKLKLIQSAEDFSGFMGHVKVNGGVHC
jgi:hypothetical protein